MYSKAELKKYSDAVATIKSITRVYEEAAARRIKLIQNSVEKVTEFIGDAADTYVNVKFGMVADQDAKGGPKKDILAKSFRPKTKKGVLVLISSHEQYFGNLIPNVFLNWKTEMEKTGFDGIILGNTGKSLLDKTDYVPKNLKAYDLNDNDPDWKLIADIGKQIGIYEKVVIFYGQYKTVLNQVAAKEDISNTITVGQVQQVKRYLFESTEDAILAFFEEEVINALLQLKVYESQIARYAARIKILEIGQVAEKMSQVLGDLSRGRRKVHKSLNNKKQLQLYTGVELWGE